MSDPAPGAAAPDDAPENAPHDAPEDAPAWAARKLLRAARSGTLATSLAGQPFASLVTPATAPDLALLLLLSSLSEHTRHLRAEPRCSVLVVGAPTGANPQTAPRATVTGLAEAVDDPGLKARYLAVHPYASLYADFGDFALWRIRPMGGLYVGGFARAARLRLADGRGGCRWLRSGAGGAGGARRVVGAGGGAGCGAGGAGSAGAGGRLTAQPRRAKSRNAATTASITACQSPGAG